MNQPHEEQNSDTGILLVNKPINKTSFSLVAALRRLLHIKKIGHAGTLDPFASGVMVMLIGKQYTRLSETFLCADKEYIAQMRLGIETDTYDCEGQIIAESPFIPSLEEVAHILTLFQGEIEQVPPMFSAKKYQGKKLYDLARKGMTIERAAVKVTLQTELLTYAYPFLTLKVTCSKGTYIRSLAHDIGKLLTCHAYLTTLQRTRSGQFLLEQCIDGTLLFDMPSCNRENIRSALIKILAS